MLAVLSPVIDPWLGPFSYAYRPGLGVADAVQAVARLRDEGLGWVARSDFHDCFAEIPVSLLRRMLRVLVEDPAMLALIEALLDARRRRASWSRACRKVRRCLRCGRTWCWPGSTRAWPAPDSPW